MSWGAVTTFVSGEVSYGVAGRTILTDIAIDIESGESVAIVGVNGAGKTTLLRLLANVLEPTRGSLSLRGTPYAAVGARGLARSLAYVPQVRPARVPLTVRDVVLLGRYPHRARLDLGYSKGDFEATTAALEVTGLEALADRPLAELSGGRAPECLHSCRTRSGHGVPPARRADDLSGPGAPTPGRAPSAGAGSEATPNRRLREPRSQPGLCVGRPRDRPGRGPPGGDGADGGGS